MILLLASQTPQTGERGQGVSQKNPVQTSTVKTRTGCTAHLLYWLHKDIHWKDRVKRDNKNVTVSSPLWNYLDAVGTLATQWAAAPSRCSDVKVRRCEFHFCHLQDKRWQKPSVTWQWCILYHFDYFLSGPMVQEMNLKCFPSFDNVFFFLKFLRCRMLTSEETRCNHCTQSFKPWHSA